MDDAEEGMDNELIGQVSSPKQSSLLSHLIADPDAWSVCAHIVKPEYFDKEFQGAVGYIADHVDKYKELPSVEMVAAETGVRLDKVDAMTDGRMRWVCDEVEKFCRLKAVINAVYDATDKIAKGDLGGLVDPIKEAVMVSLQRDLGLDYFADPMGRLKRMLDHSTIPTGFDDLDHALYGGVDPGSVTLFLAGSGVGKSLMLANVLLNFVERQKNALYISFELYQDMVGKRIDSMITGVGTRDVFARMEEVNDRIRLKAKTHGKLWIKYMSAGSTTNDVMAYVKEFTLRTGIRPDVIALDYLDLMNPKAKIRDMGNLWVKDKFVSEEVRALAGELGIPIFSASQLVRGAMDEEEHKQSHIAGGISKINTVDNVISMYQSTSMKEEGVFMLQLLKTRSSGGVGKRITILMDQNTLRMRNAPQGAHGPDPGPVADNSPGIAVPSAAQIMASSPAGSNRERLERLKTKINRRF